MPASLVEPKPSKAVISFFVILATGPVWPQDRVVETTVRQEPSSGPSKVRISAGAQYGISGLLGEAVLQTYDLLPGVFLEERLKGSVFGSDKGIADWSWYETETRVGFRLPKKGYRRAGFTYGAYHVSARIPSERTWIPYMGFQTIHQRLRLSYEEKAKSPQEPAAIRPGQGYAVAVGFHRDIAHPWTEFKASGYRPSTLWNFATTHDVGLKYYTLEFYDKKKKSWEGGYPVAFWNWERFYTPFSLGMGLELTYVNNLFTPTMFHLNTGMNFKI